MHPTQNNSGSENHGENRELQAVQSQTDSTNAQSQVSQTDKVTCQDSDMQTKDVDLQHSSMQTQPKDEKQSAQQTEVKKVSHGESQTTYAVKIVQPTSEIETQAGSWNPADNVTQTDQSMSLMVEGLSQTELEQSEVPVQTDPTIVGDQTVQATVDQAEVVCQTIKDEKDAVIQAVVDATETVAQTDFSVANLVDGAAQASVDVVFQACQATVESVVIDAQTEISMALQTDQVAQATVESYEQDMQTDITEIAEIDVQTELETGEQCNQTEVSSTEMESQTENPVSEIETQTEVETILPEISNHPEVVMQEQVETSQMSSIDGMPDLSNSQNSIRSGQVLQLVPEVSEEGCQTDPVTIIIGDASFLVKKLKGSSLSPTKVSSMGNEIEIELRADEEDTTPYDMPEKENTTAPLPSPARTRGSPAAYRARGVRTRGGPPGQRGNRGRIPAVHTYQAGGLHHTAPYYASSLGVMGGKYSCPVCSETFHESPALYEHLQNRHAEAFSLIKKPRGREGKTIQMKVHREPEPPILTPVEPMGIPVQNDQAVLLLQQQQAEELAAQQQVQQQIEIQPEQQVIIEQPAQVETTVVQETPAEVPAPVEPLIEVVQGTSEVVQEDQPQDGNLFEDPSTWQSPNKSRKRTLARRQIKDEEPAVEEESLAEDIHIVIQPSEEPEETEIVLGAKRKLESGDSAAPAKRTKAAAPEPVEVEPQEELPEEEDTTPRRRSRASLRAVKQEKAVEPAEPEIKSPRTRARPSRKSSK